MVERFGHIIDGYEVESALGHQFHSIDPYDQRPWAEVAFGDAADVDLAVAAARRAFDEGPWPRMTAEERRMLIHRFAELIIQNGEELALADTRDMGVPYAHALASDVPRAAANFRFFADHAAMATGDAYPRDDRHHLYSSYDPAGVVGAITPWNFPIMLESWKVAPAIAWGNTVVLKPSEDSPVSATILARLALKAGIPPGVFNVVHGYGPDAAGQALAASPFIDRMTYTGDRRIGKIIAGAAAENLVPVSLELGGKGANIVFDDADLDNAVEWSIRAAFGNAGQMRLSGARMYVQRGILREFMHRFIAAAEAMVVGDPKHHATQIGPLSSDAQYTKVRGYFDSIERAGGTVETGRLGDGWTIAPTVISGLSEDAPHLREEIFGPIVSMTPFDTVDQGVRLVNASPFGLNAMIFTENLSTAHKVATRLRVGTVWVNCFFIRDLRAPFGGVGQSGVGREGGNFSRDFFTEPKAVVMQLN